MERRPEARDRRHDALGNLSILTDELISAILEHLSPSDLGRLSCVSSVLYIFCNEEPIWMNICLRDGGQLAYRGSWKTTTLYRKNLLAENQCPRQPLQFDGFSSLFLYRRWYRRFTTLDRFAFDNQDLERRNNLQLEELNYRIDEKKPVLLTEVANSWPARYKWTVDQLLSNYGDDTFSISQRSSKKITMKLKDYVSYMKCQHDEDPLYIFDDKFGEAAPALLQDYCVPSLFQEDFFDVLDCDQRPPFRWLIIGPERSGASWHVDPGLTSAWNTLLCGRKRWALYPPGRVPLGVTVHVSEDDGDVNIESPSSLQWWLDVYPLLADQDKPLECTQFPGETIFVPSGWWHCVLNLDTTVAVTQNFVNTSNFEFVCLDMAPGYVHKGVCRAGFLAIKYGEDSKTDAAFEKNLLNHSDMSRREKRLKVMEPAKEQHGHRGSCNSISVHSDAFENGNRKFSYDVEFLSMFLDKDIDFYNTICSPSNILGEREMRAWLHKLWVLKPPMRKLIWKGACLVLNVEKWSACLMEICSHHNLPLPTNEEKFPIGTGSNPVFLVSENAIKIYAEGGLGFSVHGLGTELEFYSFLDKMKSPLMNHVPDIISSGFVVADGIGFRTYPWDGRGIPDMISNSGFVCRGSTTEGFPFGVWSKKQFELENHGVNMCSQIWPFIVSRRCKGDIFANLRDLLSEIEAFRLASFLGEQLHHLHLLPLPRFQIDPDGISAERKIREGQYKLPAETVFMDVDRKDHNTSGEWEFVIAALNRRKNNIKNHLAQWGDPIPGFLIGKVEEYLPHDLSNLFYRKKDSHGPLENITSPTWIHSDIMDDNIHMKQCCSSDFFNGEANLRWCPSHILDFSDLSIGDPLCDLIPIYLDVFRGDMCLLKKLLESYKLPLITKRLNDEFSSGQAEFDNYNRLSYRAMCYCILHEENVLGAIFSLWKELRLVKSWEEVEEAVWGELNSY